MHTSCCSSKYICLRVGFNRLICSLIVPIFICVAAAARSLYISSESSVELIAQQTRWNTILLLSLSTDRASFHMYSMHAVVTAWSFQQVKVVDPSGAIYYDMAT
jgi:hypothetical protein